MKMNLLALLALPAFALGGALLHAAEEDAPPQPRPPYLAAVPDDTHWLVTFHYPPEEAPKPGEKPAPAPVPPVSKIDLIKTGDLRLVTVTLASGTPQVYYQHGDWVVTADPENNQQAQVLVPSPNHLPYPFYTTGFMLMDGMKPDPATFTGLVKYKDKPTFHYQTPQGEVWIAPGSMLPVAVKSAREGLIAEYQFLPAPPAAIEIPRGEALALQRAQGAYQAVRAMR